MRQLVRRHEGQVARSWPPPQLNHGLRFIPSARAALIFATLPLLTLLLSTALGRERLTLPKTAGVLLTIAGVALVLGEKTLARDTAGGWTGELFVFASAASGAVCSVLYRPYVAKYPTLPVSALAMLASVVFLAPLAAREGAAILGALALGCVALGLWLAHRPDAPAPAALQ